MKHMINLRQAKKLVPYNYLFLHGFQINAYINFRP